MGLSEPVLRAVDAVMVSVPDLDAGIAFYRDRLGHRLRWRNDDLGQAALECPDSATEIVLSTTQRAEPNWLVRDASQAAEIVERAGGRLLQPLIDIPVGKVAIVEDPFGNRLVLVDLSKGVYQTDADGTVIGVARGE
ncbi:VOC family protein [Microlunatus sp. Gsoil 973]|jgi:predicted enzyme related to lactoylglutathione lyase|uniref:VOC family protein n=1 Tax=Microlunatus sp. Gsoil 973 TaxID=2672569 RepID=UPI0018A80DF4|nr:VOC family protein [Microlunatus sp. Gsoil 973]